MNLEPEYSLDTISKWYRTGKLSSKWQVRQACQLLDTVTISEIQLKQHQKLLSDCGVQIADENERDSVNSPIRVSQYNETDDLKLCVIGRYDSYMEFGEYEQLVNNDQLDSEKPAPTSEQLEEEFTAFKNALVENGVEVIEPNKVGRFVYDQLTPRDIGVVIGNRFLVCNMKKWSRRYEIAGVFDVINRMHRSGKWDIVVPGMKKCGETALKDDSEILIEGGDIIVDKGFIFVGVSQRTTEEGFEFIKQEFGNEFKVVKVKTAPEKSKTGLKNGGKEEEDKKTETGEKQKSEVSKGDYNAKENTNDNSNSENVLHLDCTFNPIGDKYALIYTNGFKKDKNDKPIIPQEIKDNYTFITVNKEEQEALATNVLSISNKVVIARGKNKHCDEVNKRIRAKGIKVVEVKFDGAPNTGGSFRCCSLPLIRKTSNTVN